MGRCVTFLFPSCRHDLGHFVLFAAACPSAGIEDLARTAGVMCFPLLFILFLLLAARDGIILKRLAPVRILPDISGTAVFAISDGSWRLVINLLLQFLLALTSPRPGLMALHQ